MIILTAVIMKMTKRGVLLIADQILCIRRRGVRTIEGLKSHVPYFASVLLLKFEFTLIKYTREIISNLNYS